MKTTQCFSFVIVLLILLVQRGIDGSPSGSVKSNFNPKQRQIGINVKAGHGKISRDISISADSDTASNKVLSSTAIEFSNTTKKANATTSKEGSLWSLFSNFPFEEVLKEIVNSKSNSNAIENLEKIKGKLIEKFGKKTGEFATGRQGYGGYGAHGFPSLEGALLSIAFLTFAVFLIDLIQQLLSRIRTGTAGVVPLVGRRRRSAFPENEYHRHDLLMDLTASVFKALKTA